MTPNACQERGSASPSSAQDRVSIQAAVRLTTEQKDGKEVVTEVHIRPASPPACSPALPGADRGNEYCGQFSAA